MQALENLASVVAVILIVAATCEQILEAFRGLLERFGITFLKSKISFEEATADALAVLPGQLPDGSSSVAVAKAQALVKFAKTLPTVVKTAENAGTKFLTALDALPGGQAIGTSLIDALGTEVDAVKASLENSERKRLWYLRLISVSICLVIGFYFGINAFAILETEAALGGGLNGWSGICLTAIAASAGSGYWHDQLDNIRKLKSALPSKS